MAACNPSTEYSIKQHCRKRKNRKSGRLASKPKVQYKRK